MTMKILALLAALCLPLLCHAREVGIEWDPNPPAENVTSYRVEIRSLEGETWEPIGEPTPKPAILLATFPEGAREIRLFATNAAGDSPPSPPFLVPALPSVVEGVRLNITLQITLPTGGQ